MLQVVAGWRLDGANFDYQTYKLGVGRNFSAITWVNSSTIGCAVAECENGQYFKCLTDPRGNYPGDSTIRHS